jgi:UDP-2,4-diacetamido-2,4,6-trideoxy-beta-L-altropyranose hydrolase
MKVAFRVDASSDIGTGHVMRCLTLAHALAEQGACCEFIGRAHEGHLINFVREQGFTVHILPLESLACEVVDGTAHAHWLGASQTQDAHACEPMLKVLQPDWLVVDHYALDRCWEQAMRPFTGRIMAIDDLVDRSHDCDLLLDQNLGRQAKDYDGLLSRHTQSLIGPAYALLRPEFSQWRGHSLQRRAQLQLNNLLITMGGVDQTNATGQVLAALTHCELPTDLRITVVMGPTAPWLAQVQAQAAAMPCPTQVQAGVSNMAQLMAESDLCIGAAGGSAWERCALGLPTLVLILAENQHSGAMALQSNGAAWVAADVQQLMTQITGLFNKEMQTAALQKMSQAAAKLATGNGASQVVELLLEPHV